MLWSGIRWPDRRLSSVHGLMTLKSPAEMSLLVFKGCLINGIQDLKDTHNFRDLVPDAPMR